MHIIQPSVEIEDQDWDLMLRRIEKKGRVCYKSEDRITDTSAAAFVAMLNKSGHLSVLEHGSMSIKFTVDRGISHELARHRVASPSQESTRYCNYGNDDKGITVIKPFFFPPSSDIDSLQYYTWLTSCEASEFAYLELLRLGATPQEARDVLVNSLKTEMWITANMREWSNVIFPQRCSPKAHPQMRQAMIPTLLKMKTLVPAIFAEVPYDTRFNPEHYASVAIVA